MASQLAKLVADFRTTLATEIAVGGTTGTLQSVTDSDGNTIPNGIHFLTLDGDGTQKEYIACTVTGTALTNIRTINRQGTQASGTVRKHRIGAKVQITNFAHIKYMLDLLDGTTDFDATNPLRYDAVPTITSGMVETLATVDYVNGVALAGAPDAQTNVKGVVELATVAEQGTATATGSTGANLVPANANLVKTSSGAADENKIPILDASGLLDPSFTGLSNTNYSGVVELATGAEMAAGTATGGTGGPLVPPNSQFIAASSGSADANKVAVLGSAGTIAPGFFALTGTSGEAITAGDGVYLKASDSKLYKVDADADESTFSFVGIAVDTVGAADLTLRYAPPGHVVSGLAGLTAGAYYFITGTAGTLGTTPGTRFARVGFAVSTTQMQVLAPKYIATGLLTASGVSTGATNTAVTGFYPAKISFLSTSNDTATDNTLGVNGDFWAVADNGGSATQTTGTSFLSNFFLYEENTVYRNSGATNSWEALVSSRTQTGFVIKYNIRSGSGTHTSYIRWTAESL